MSFWYCQLELSTKTNLVLERLARRVQVLFAQEGTELRNLGLVLLDESLGVHDLLALGRQHDALEALGKAEGRNRLGHVDR